MEQPIGIRLPKELLRNIEKLSKKEMEDRSTVIRKLVMLGFKDFVLKKAAEEYIQGNITFSEAANEANATLWEFEKYLVEHGFKSNYSIEDLEREMKLLENLK